MGLPEAIRTVLVRRRGTFLLVLVVCLAVGVAAGRLLPERYEATALLFVGQDRPISASGSSQRDDVLARSYVELLSAPSVADRAMSQLSWNPDRAALLGALRFEVKAGTQLVAITGTDGDPQRAAQITNVYAETFVETRRETDAEVRRSRLDEVRDDVRSAADRLAAIEQDADPAREVERDELRAELASLRVSYEALQESMVLEGRNVTLSSPAVTPTAASAPRPTLYLVTAFVLGLILAALAALLRDRMDRRKLSEEDVIRIVGAPVLARVPVIRRASEAAASEAFAFLRFNLVAEVVPRVTLITSAGEGEGKTTVAFRLAQELANAGASVISADLDLSVRGLSRRVLGHPDVGLVDVVGGRAAVEQTLVATQVPDLRIAVAGMSEAQSRQRFSIDQMSALFRELADEADLVVVDSAPVAASVDTSVIAAAGADAVVLVVDLRIETQDRLRDTVGQLARSGASIRGVVINRAEVDAYAYGVKRKRFRRPSRRNAAARR